MLIDFFITNHLRIEPLQNEYLQGFQQKLVLYGDIMGYRTICFEPKHAWDVP